MKPLELHPLSALAGAAALGLTLVAAGAVQVRPDKRVQVGSVEPLGNSTQSLRIVNPIEVVGIPDARDMLVIEEGMPYVVPGGKLFVLTGLGATVPGSPASVRMFVDGVQVLQTPAGGNNNASVFPVPPGLTVPAGSTITLMHIVGTPDVARAWGYLVDA